MGLKPFKKRSLKAAAFVVGVLSCVLLWTAWSFAGVESKTIYIFPGQVVADGWDNEAASLVQDLSGAAVFEDFTLENAARVVLSERASSETEATLPEASTSTAYYFHDGSYDLTSREWLAKRVGTTPVWAQEVEPEPAAPEPEPEPEPEPAPEPEPEPEPTPEPTPDTDDTSEGEVVEPDPEAASTETGTDVDPETPPMDEETAAGEGEIDEDVNEAATSTIDQPDEVQDEVTEGDDEVGTTTTSGDEDLSATSTTVAPPTESDTQVSSGGGGGGSSRPENADDEVTVCSVTGEECHVIEFGGFSVGAQPDHDITNMQLRVSMAAEADVEALTNDKILVRYKFRDAWYLVGEIPLAGVISNQSNGGHFLFALPEVTEWNDLGELSVQLELVRQSDGAASVWLDAIWLDAEYEVPVLDEVGSVLGEHTSTELVARDRSNNPDFLTIAEGEVIEFAFTDDVTNESLIIKSDRETYRGGSTRTVNFSVVNTLPEEQTFELAFYRLASSTRFKNLKQWMHNIPVATTTETTGEVAFFCEAGWEALATSSLELWHECAGSGERQVCEYLNQDASNCIVSQVIDSVETVEYQSAFVSRELRDFSEASFVNARQVPLFAEGIARAEEPLRVPPLGVVYFQVEVEAPGTSKLGDFFIEARGEDEVFGLLGPAREYTLFEELVTDESLQATLLAPRFSFAEDDLVFWFSYKKRESLWRQIKEFIMGESEHNVVALKLLHASGKEIRLPYEIIYGDEGEWSVTFKEARKKLHPGKYRLVIEHQDGSQTFLDDAVFYWGVLAANTNQTIFELGQETHFTFGALSDTGSTICDADLELTVTEPSGVGSTVPVERTGACQGNNVTDTPDYEAFYTASTTGEYTYEVVFRNEFEEVVNTLSRIFVVASSAPYLVERVGPTRIFPLAPYDMEVTVTARDGFSGVLKETLPYNFVIVDGGAFDESVNGDVRELSLTLDLLPGESVTETYRFDAPDISPFMFRAGPLTLQEGTSTVFQDLEDWQIASDVTGDMVALWDGGSTPPTGWDCVSCASTSTFYQRFIVGSSTYGVTGGTETHTHTASGNVGASSATALEDRSGTGATLTGHGHTLTPSIGTAYNLPPYRQLQVIRRQGPGTPGSLPAGIILIFDETVPAGFTRYSAQDNYFIRGENTAAVASGTIYHQHSIDGTTSGPTGGTITIRGGNPKEFGATDTHTHTVATSTYPDSHIPPYRGVILGKLDSATTTVPVGVMAMWSDEPPLGWTTTSSSSEPLENRFIIGSSTYGSVGGASTHTPSNVTVLSSVPNTGGIEGRSSPAPIVGSDEAHQHSVLIDNFSSASNLPPYASAIFAEFQGVEPLFEQSAFRFYVNEDAETPTNPWPSEAVTDLIENEPITATTTTVKSGDEIRIRMAATVSNSTSTAGEVFKLQYGEGEVCSAISSWVDVGATTSSEIWRGVDNGSVADGVTLSSTTLSVSNVFASYEEENNATPTPSDIGVDEVAEWDWVLENNGATSSTKYCFRMVESDGTEFDSYATYPQLLTDQTPIVTDLFDPFDNEKVASSSIYFEFVATDPEINEPEIDRLQYQIEIDEDPLFGSPDISGDSSVNSTPFKNRIETNDKAPYTNSQRMRYEAASLATSTYWWRVRAKDPSGTNEWGEWATSSSFTIDTTIENSAWFQTTDDQFSTDSLSNVATTGSESVELVSGQSSGTLTSPPIVFSDGSDNGTVWGELSWSDNEPASTDLLYQLQYLTGTSTWTLIPDSDLAGNSAGFDGGTVLLEALDVETYATIRIVANFSATPPATPTLNDWTVSWGTRVEQPTLSKPFDNEKVVTDTPFFEFSAVDLQGDDLTYQISWSADNTFSSGSTTYTSDVSSSSFENISDAGDDEPFTQGDTVRFTIPGGDALATSTYWWRVRAKDPGGGDSYSEWSDLRSITLDTTITQSTWYQNTEEQFETDTLAGLVAQVDDTVTVATTTGNALMVYAEGTTQEPQYRFWDGTSWGSENAALSVGGTIYWVVTKAGTTRDEYIVGTLDSFGDVNVQVYQDGAWGDLFEVTAAAPNTSARAFDIAYESLSGDALVVACDGDANPVYYVWDGDDWSTSTPGSITMTGSNNCEWIKLASDPSSDNIALLSLDQGGSQYQAAVWTGSSWGSQTTFGSMNETNHEGMALAFEDSGGQAVAVVSNGNSPNIQWNAWTSGGGWSGTSNLNVGGIEFGSMQNDDGSDNMVMCFVDDANDINVLRWTGATFAASVELDGVGNGKTSRPVECTFETLLGTDGDIVAVYGDGTSGRYQTYSGSWSGELSIGADIGSAVVAQTRRTGDGTILAAMFENGTAEYNVVAWNGTSWGATTTVETSPSISASPWREPFMIAAQNPSSDGVIRSSAIDFDDGDGPGFEEFLWTDSEPAGTALYSVEYYSTSSESWVLIPDSVITGNSAGIGTSPIDLTGVDTDLYNMIRLVGTLTCSGGTCPLLLDWTVTWQEGPAIEGTAQQYDRSTNVTSGVVEVAVNGVIQSGKTGSITGVGTWQIRNVDMEAGDVVHVFVQGAQESSEAIAVFKYDGTGTSTGVRLYEQHLSIGSDDNQTITNADIALFDNSVSGDEDIFFDVNAGNDLDVCATGGCQSASLYIASGDVYQPDVSGSGDVANTHDLIIDGEFIPNGNTVYVEGSWDNNGGFASGTSTIVFAATSSSETIDSTGAATSSFNNITFGFSSGVATWTLQSDLDIDGNTTITYGTLVPDATSLTLAGNLAIGASGGFVYGSGTTTFDGTTSATWSDATASKQSLGNVVIDGTSKTVTLSSSVKAHDVTVGADDALAFGSQTLEVTGDFTNNGTFSGTGTLLATATTTGRTLTNGSSNFYNLTFNGAGGLWSFGTPNPTITNNLSIATGTVTFVTGTTTIGGSFTNSGGAFMHNNGVLYFTSVGSANLTFGNYATNNLTFAGAGTKTFLDTHATTSATTTILAGSVVLPNGIYEIGGSLLNQGGTITANYGEVRFTSVGGADITLGGSSLYDLSIDSLATMTMTESNATSSCNVVIDQGTLVFPSGYFAIGCSLINNDTFDSNGGMVNFSATTTGMSITPGGSDFANVHFTTAGGGWTLTQDATSTGAWRILNGTSLDLSNQTLAVGGEFENQVGGTATEWAGSTLVLSSGGAYTVSDKDVAGEDYETLLVLNGTDVRFWQSQATTTTVASGSIYSQNHASSSGALSIWGDYTRSSGADYWSYGTDFDGASLSGSERAVTVSINGGATVGYDSGATLEIIGGAAATTTVGNQGSGQYTLSLTDGYVSAQYAAFRNTDTNGFQILGSSTVPLFRSLDFELGINGGTTLTLSSTTIDNKPTFQSLYNRFATSSGVTTGFNVTATGTPVSYWWFREAYGNYEGEAYNDDPGGDPGNIRWDDSSVSVAISGNVYSGEGSGVPAACDDSNPVVTIVVGTSTTYSGFCSSADGSYSIPGVSVTGDVRMIAYLASTTPQAATVTKTPSGAVDDFDLYQGHVIVRHEDTDPITIADMVNFDGDDDSDVPFDADLGSPNSLTVDPDTALLVWATKEFAPGGDVTLVSGGSGNYRDGSLLLTSTSTLTAAGTESYSIGGSWRASSTATFTRANETVTFTSTTSAREIIEDDTFTDLIFSGAGGEWTLASDVTVNDSVAINAGTLLGTNDLTIETGTLAGDGAINLTGGTVVLETSGAFGGDTDWTFYALTLGDGATPGTTTKTGAGDITLSDQLAISTNHTLEATDDVWTFTGSSTVFSVFGTFNADTSTTSYTSVDALIVAPEIYYNLYLAPSGAGSPIYTLAAGGQTVGNLMLIGDGTNAVTVQANTNDPLIDVAGDFVIQVGATFVEAGSNDLRLAGSYSNAGTFTASGGTVVFDSSDIGETIDAGASSFGNVSFNNNGGGWLLLDHATATANVALTNLSSFDLSSGVVLAVGGTFTNEVGGGATDWSDSTLSLYSGTNYTINATSTGADVYGTLLVGANTDVRMWNSSAGAYSVVSSGSLYSQDHATVDGDLYIWGDYVRSSGADYWSYETDFDGTDLAATNDERRVDVYMATSAEVTLSGGSLSLLGDATASTTVQNQGSGTYSLTVSGGTFNAQYYRLEDMDSDGLTFSGAPTVTGLGDGEYLIGVDAGTGITVAGSVINANPLKTFFRNTFASSSATVATGTNVTATGVTVSSWRFTQAVGDLAGEPFDNDPSGNPGYIVWDDSEGNILITGSVYADEGTAVSTVCDGSTPVVRMLIESATTSSITSCDGSTGQFSFVDVVYVLDDTITLYLDTDGGVEAANVLLDPVTNIGDADLYENRTIVRNENLDPITIADIAVFDTNDDSDIPFTAATGTPDTLSIDAGDKLIVWNNKTFAPGGDVTVPVNTSTSSAGDVELRDGATWQGAGTDEYSIGGDWLAGSGSSIEGADTLFTFTGTEPGYVIEVGDGDFSNIDFTGGGSWTFTDAAATTTGDITITSGSTTFPATRLSIGGSFSNNDTMTVGTAEWRFTGSGAETIDLGATTLYDTSFVGSGSWSFTEGAATTTGSLVIEDGAVTFPTNTYVVGGSFTNATGTFTASNRTIFNGTTTGLTITAGGSDFASTTFSGSGGSWSFADVNATSTGSVVIEAGSLTLPSGVMTIAGSLDNQVNAAALNTNAGTLFFNGSLASQTIDPAGALLGNVLIDGSGGWTVATSATSTGYWYLLNVGSYTQGTGTTLEIGGAYANVVGGTATDWTNATLYLNASGTTMTVNTKTTPTEYYSTLLVGPNMDVSVWNSGASTTNVESTSILYSQDHLGLDGDLYLWGDYSRSSGTEYWSAATDFDGTSLGALARAVDVRINDGGSVTIENASFELLGTSTASTTVANQGSGDFTLSLTNGDLSAQYFSITDTDTSGLQLLGTTSITTLANGDFTVSVDGATAMTVASSTITQNPTETYSTFQFATTTAISATNITVSGTTSNYWTLSRTYGNLSGEDFDVDGDDACGSIRWGDSVCLELSQSNFRFRNDDGGEGAPASEWYDQSFTKRTRITVTNNDTGTLTDVPIKIDLPYDSDMRSDYGDLRFTNDGGTTSLPYWIEATTTATATVWVKLDSIEPESSEPIFVYYASSTAVSTSDGDSVFTFFEDFEDGSISEYSGDTGIFDVLTTSPYQGSYGLWAGVGDEDAQATDGIYRDVGTTATERGTRIRFYQYVDATTGDEPCALFGVQSPGSSNENYAVCLDQFRTVNFESVTLAKDVAYNDDSATILASTSVTYTTGWYEVVIDWLTNGDINVTVYDDAGSVFATVSDNDTEYTQGGVGFTFWFHEGGWDLYTAAPYIGTDPTYRILGEQENSGASWKEEQNTTLVGQLPNETFRLRFGLQNSGTGITNQQFRLQYAAKTGYGVCAAVPDVDFDDVPNQAGCSGSPVCTVTSTEFDDQATTTQHLNTSFAGDFTPGYMIESPSNQTSLMSMATSTFTEVEYAVEMTSNATESSYCMRVTNGGLELDTYAFIPEVVVSQIPSISDWNLHSYLVSGVTLTEGVTTAVVATGTITDFNGFGDIQFASSTFYRTSLGTDCSSDENNCYPLASTSCPLTNCSGNSCDVTCTAYLQYFAEPTDAFSIYSGDTWSAQLYTVDGTNEAATSTSDPVEVNTTRALSVLTGDIDFGTLSVGEDTGSFNATSTIRNTGNDAIDVDLSGTDLTAGASNIVVGNIKYASSSFTYSGCGICQFLSGTATSVETDLPKPTSSTTPVTDDLYWGIAVPTDTAGLTHNGINTFMAVSD